ncbi:MAG TPA: molybdopterin-binding protein [Usitatibacter sp.]|nr:molybdopterin-binding protein [Usitatibacter sp.]
MNARRSFLLRAVGGIGTLLLAGCDRLSRTTWFPPILESAESLTYRAQRLVTARRSMAREYTEADLSPRFRSNGTAVPEDEQYLVLAKGGFADWRLRVGGLVAHPLALSLEELRAMPSRTQITRHDCVEGWSAIGKWTGVPLSAVLARAVPSPSARYVVFRCADPMEGTEQSKYYESVDMEDAYHPQTILAYGLNGAPLPIPNGAPLRLRVERQLGYKMAKYLMSIELVEDFSGIRGGRGGYWEDQGYEWYAGI